MVSRSSGSPFPRYELVSSEGLIFDFPVRDGVHSGLLITADSISAQAPEKPRKLRVDHTVAASIIEWSRIA